MVLPVKKRKRFRVCSRRRRRAPAAACLEVGAGVIAGIPARVENGWDVPGARILTEEQQRRLRRVAKVRRRSDEVRSELVAAIRDAHEAGCSLRSIEDFAGMSYQRVHQILRGD